MITGMCNFYVDCILPLLGLLSLCVGKAKANLQKCSSN